MIGKVPFVSVDELSKSLIAHEKSENKRRNFPFNAEIFSPERSTECERKILYDIYGSKQIISDKSEDANSLRDKWISLMMRMPDVILHGVDVEFSDMKYSLSGKVDMVLEFEKWEIKTIATVRATTKDLILKMRDKGPIRKHLIIDNVCMWLSEIPHSIMIYEDVKNKEIEVFHCVPYNPIIEEVREKFAKISDLKLKGLLADRPYKKQERECLSCSHKEKCWEE